MSNAKCPVESPFYPGQEEPKNILPTTPPPPPPPDLHAALDKIDVKRVRSYLETNPAWKDTVPSEATAWVIDGVIAAIREQLPPPVTR